MFLFLLPLLVSSADALSSTDVERAVSVIRTKGFMIPPAPARVVDLGVNPPVVKLIQMSGYGLQVDVCPGYAGIVVSYMANADKTAQILGIMVSVDKQTILMTDENLDGVPEEFIPADTTVTSTERKRAFENVLICVLQM